ncbi:MAG: hypothetical protein VB070_01480 [Clostridiaceae bacterium]|nr:hypothetical protein [Clostridiaceae bacterium]
MSSPITLFTVVVFGQFDIICVFLALCGIYFFYKKKYYKFVIMFGLAITFKAYMLFILIPLILLIEKRVLHIIKYLLISSWCMILERLLFLNDPYCSLSKNYIHDTYGFMKRIYNYGVNLQVGPVFLLGIVMVFVCVFAYRQKKDPLIVTPYSYYLSFLVNAALILSIHWHPQWMIILVPFLVINTFMFSEFKLSVYLQYFMFAFFLIETYMVFYKNVDQAMINNGILPLLTGKYLSPDSVTYASLLDKLKLPVSVYNTLLIGCGLSFAYLFKPAPSLPAGNDQPESDFDHRLIWGNLGLIYIYIIPTLIIYFLKAV